MAKFIKLHQGKDICIVNTKYIISVEPSETDTGFPTVVWCCEDNSVDVNETPEEIFEMLKPKKIPRKK
jgi:hypothetical protein